MDFALNDIETKTAADTGVVVPLIRLDGSPLLNAKGKEVSLTLLGADSALYRKEMRAMTRIRLERAQKNKGKFATDEQMDLGEREDNELLAKVTVGWDGILDTAGKPIEFSREGAVELYAKFPVAREQAEAAVGDRSRFTKPSSKG